MEWWHTVYLQNIYKKLYNRYNQTSLPESPRYDEYDSSPLMALRENILKKHPPLPVQLSSMLTVFHKMSTLLNNNSLSKTPVALVHMSLDLPLLWWIGYRCFHILFFGAMIQTMMTVILSTLKNNSVTHFSNSNEINLIENARLLICTSHMKPKAYGIWASLAYCMYAASLTYWTVWSSNQDICVKYLYDRTWAISLKVSFICNLQYRTIHKVLGEIL